MMEVEIVDAGVDFAGANVEALGDLLADLFVDLEEVKSRLGLRTPKRDSRQQGLSW